MNIRQELIQKGFWPHEDEMRSPTARNLLTAFGDTSLNEDSGALLTSLLKLSETNVRNNILECKVIASLFVALDMDQYDVFFEAYSNVAAIAFPGTKIGYDAVVQKVQAGMLLLNYPKMEVVTDQTILQILFRFLEKNADLGHSICSTGIISGAVPTNVLELSGSEGRSKLRALLRGLTSKNPKPEEDRRRTLERLVGKHIASLQAVERDVKEYGLDPTISSDLAEVSKALQLVKDQLRQIRTRIMAAADEEVRRICSAA